MDDTRDKFRYVEVKPKLVATWVKRATDAEVDAATAAALGAAMRDHLRYQRVVTELAIAFPFPLSELQRVARELMLARLRLGMWWIPETDEQITLWAAALLAGVASGTEFAMQLPNWIATAKALWQRN